MEYNHYIIDMSSNNNFVQIPTMQGDGNNVRGFEVELISNGTQYVVDAENTIVSIMGTKTDTSQICNECTVSDKGYILVNITSQMSAVKGRGDYCIVLMDKNTNSQLKSFPFYILTTSAPFNISEIISSDEFQLLTKRVIETEDIINRGNEEILALQELNMEVTENENSRVSFEEERVTSENARVNAEIEREKTFNSVMESANAEVERLQKENETASISAELATTNANIATEQAELTSISAVNARESELNAKESEEIATEQATIATESANKASVSEINAEIYMNTAIEKADETKASEVIAITKANEVSTSATNAALSETNAKDSETVATTMANLSKSYAVGTDGVVRSNDATHNSKYFCELAERHANAATGIVYRGTRPFSALSLEENQKTNYLFNISEKFVSDDTFEDGAGIKYPAGTNVCRTEQGTWDVFTGIESFGTGEIVTESIYDEPTDQSKGEYWIFTY